MKKPKLLKTALTAALAATLLLPCAAAGAEMSAKEGAAEQPAYTLMQRSESFPIQVWGQAAELGDNSLTLQNDNEGAAYAKIVVNVEEDTKILDAVTGEEKSFADIRKNEILYAWVGPAMTKSLPPIASASIILCNIPADFGVPTYAEVQSVAETEAGVDVYVSGDVVLHLTGETQYLAGPGNTCGTVSAADLYPGVRILSWYDVVTMSLPAQAAPGKVMVFPSAYAGWVTAEGLSVSVNGEALELSGASAARVENDRLLVPVRKVAEALGYQVSWEPYTNRVTVSEGGGELYHFTIGEEQAAKGDVTVGLVAPTQAVDGVTFMALDDLISLHVLKLESNWF